MAEREGGQWNVAVKNNVVHVERVSDSGDQRFDDLLEPDEARKLGELLTKHAGKAGESEKSDESGDDQDSDESDDDQDSSDESDEKDGSEKKSDQAD